MNFLVTGATGFIGSELVRFLIAQPYTQKVYVLIRPKSGISESDRLAKLLKSWQQYFDTSPEQSMRIFPIVLDLQDAPKLPKLQDVNIVFHCAASVELGQALTPARQANLYTTQRVLRMARHMPHLKRFVHVSTAYVLGRYSGQITEEMRPQRFNNWYEKSKYEAEHCVVTSGLPYTIIRPSTVVGDSKHGYILGLKVFYTAVRMWLTGRIPRAPLDVKAAVDLVPVDHVVKASCALAIEDAAVNETFHISCGHQFVNPVQIFKYAVTELNLSPPKYAPQWVATLLSMPWIKPLVGHALAEVLDVMRHHLPYLGTRGRVFDSTKAEIVLAKHGIACPHLDAYGSQMFRFCRETRWGKIPMRLEG